LRWLLTDAGELNLRRAQGVKVFLASLEQRARTFGKKHMLPIEENVVAK